MKFKNHYWVRIRERESGLVTTEFEGYNLTCTEGVNDLLDGDLDLDNLYVGLIDSSGFTAVAAGDTGAQIGGTNGWDESTDYSEGTRPAWSPDVASSRSKSNSTTVDFTMAGNDGIQGFFTSNFATKGDTASTTLFSATEFTAGAQTPSASQIIQLTYTISIAS